MNLKLTELVLLACLGCTSNYKNKDVTELRESLPQIETPITFNSDIRAKYKTVELPNNELIQKLNHSPFSLFGKLLETDSTITILGYTYQEIGTPVLITFDNEGNEISKHVVFETAKSTLGQHTSNRVTLFPNREIVFTDSTIIWKLNPEQTEELPGTDSLILTQKKYSIADDGKITNLN